MEKWFVTTKKADFEKWARELQISPILARIIRNRDLTRLDEVEKYLHGTLRDCYSPWLLKDMKGAVELIQDAIGRGIRIRVIGDYDVDGICSSYILTKGLQILGAVVDTAIPHRIRDGYGLNENLIEEAKRDGVGMIVTCDNGIAAASQIQLAMDYEIQVIVTDHHEVPFVIKETEQGTVKEEILPPAKAVIDPKQNGCGYPYPGICGGVVAYKVMAALAEKTGNDALLGCMDELLEFAAFATVCDVMELRDENRILVKEGLKRLRKSHNLGLLALMEVNAIEPGKLNAYHLGFVLGPCLNATGRLDTAKRALELLQSKTKAEAMSAAAKLKELNDSRKTLTMKGVEQAFQVIDSNHMNRDKVIVVYLPEVHESLAGIIAGRVREAYNHPVFVLTKGEDGVKGSGRSIEGYHMYEAMTEVKELFSKYGGHAMAAGLSMEEKDIDTLRTRLNELCQLEEEDFIQKIHIDVPLPLEYGTEELVDQLELLEPFGVSNPKPLFAQKNLVFTKGYKMGANKSFARFLVMTPQGTGKQLVYFGNLAAFEGFLDEKYGSGSAERLFEGRAKYEISVVYQLGKNTFRGNTEIQYIMQYYC